VQEGWQGHCRRLVDKSVMIDTRGYYPTSQPGFALLLSAPLRIAVLPSASALPLHLLCATMHTHHITL
jgi:hypothetical protein